MRLLVLALLFSWQALAKNENPNTALYKVQFRVYVTDAYGVELKKYDLKGYLEANRMEERCLLDLGEEVKKYLKSQLQCNLLSDLDEYYVEKTDFFKLLEEMSVLNVKKKDLLKRLTGVFTHLRENGFGVYFQNLSLDKTYFPLREQKDLIYEFRAEKEPLKELVRLEVKLKKTKKKT